MKKINNKYLLDDECIWLPLNLNIELEHERLGVGDHELVSDVSDKIRLVCLAEYSSREQEAIIKEFELYSKNFPIELRGFHDRYTLFEHDKKANLVQLGDVINLGNFNKHINENFKLLLPPQPIYINLYSKEIGEHIDICSFTDLDDYGRHVILDIKKK